MKCKIDANLLFKFHVGPYWNCSRNLL